MDKKKIFLTVIAAFFVIAVAAADFVKTSPKLASLSRAKAEADVITGIGNFLNDLKFWEPKTSGNTPTVSSTDGGTGFLKDEGAESYESKIEFEKAIISAVDKASLGVVSVVVTKDVPILERCPVTDPYFGPNFKFYVPCDSGRTEKQEIGGGTGFFVSSDGLILTNKHVIQDKNAEYTVFSGKDASYAAKVVKIDDAEDLALLKVEGVGFPVLNLGNSDSVRLGQTAIAIGNALGEYKDTVSVGVISGLARTITATDQSGDTETIENVLQTDAAINPGNSGGPLINLKGEVIGINVAVAYNAENIGFAIPINKARNILNTEQ
ncbi:MAG: trypsin-like peptidase domain-containing protein [Parcubacteria group bacterium]